MSQMYAPGVPLVAGGADHPALTCGSAGSLPGGTTKSGFDCSGLTQSVYRHWGRQIVRTSDEQFHEFRAESHAQAQPGDLVFFRDTSNLRSHVYHVGVFEGGHYMVAATHPGSDVQWQSYLWGGNTISFGTITH